MFEQQLKQLYRKTDRGLWECKCCEATCEDLEELLLDATYHSEKCLAGRLTWFSYQITKDRKYYDRDNYIRRETEEPDCGRDLEVLSKTVGNTLQVAQEYYRSLEGSIVNRQIVLPFTDDEIEFSNNIINPIFQQRKRIQEGKDRNKEVERKSSEAKIALATAKRLGVLTEEEYQEKLKKLT